MDPELQKLLETAQRAREGGVSVADINKALKGRGAPSFAELTQMAQGPQEPPMKASLLSRLGTALGEAITPSGITKAFAQGATAGSGGANPLGLIAAATPGAGIAPRGLEELRPVVDISRMAGRGATLGLLEEAAALPRLAPGGQTFGEARQAGQAESAAARERLGPGVSTAAELAGALAIPGRAGAELVRRGTTIAAKTGRSAGLGAGVGAVVGAAETPTLEDIGRSTAISATLGGVFGGALPLAGALLTVPGRIGSILWGVFSPTKAGQRVDRALMRQLGKVLDRSPQELEVEFARQSARRPGLVTPADIDPQIGALAQSRAPASSGAVRPLVENVQGRAVGRGQRLAEDVPELTGLGQREAAEVAARARLEALGPTLFKPLEAAHPVVADPRLTKFLEQPAVAKLWKKVRPAEGEPGLVHFQELRGELRDAISSLQRRGKSFARRRTQGQHDDLTALLEDVVPGFRAVNLQYYQTAEGVRGFDLGAQAIKKFWSGERVTREIAGLQQRAGPEAANALLAVRHGAADEVIRQLLSKSGKSTAQRLASLNQSQRQVMRMLFPDERQFTEFLERAVLENRMSGLRIPVGAQAVQLAQEGGVQSGLASPFVGLRFLALRELFRRAGPEKLRASADATLTRLLATDPQAMQRLTAAMRTPGGGVAGLLTAGLPEPAQGLLNR